MIGRVEIFEILGMAGTCAVVLFAGFSVETLEADAGSSRAATVEVQAPEVPGIGLPEEVRLQVPELQRPVHPAPPALSVAPAPEQVHQSYTCGCRDVIS